VHVEYGELQTHFEGSVEDVTHALLDYLKTVHPAFSLAAKLMYKPDLMELSSLLEGVVEYSSEGLILLRTDFTADEAILTVLLGVYLGSRIGALTENTISVNTIANISRKASKTILNQIKNMIDDGYVVRVGKGEYQIKNLGIKKMEAFLRNERSNK
jgi:oligoribonuclease NrnB/cAMP/cGMP phosphodiesterase (DHH superfamily)